MPEGLGMSTSLLDAEQQLADPLVDPDVDGVARFLADRLAQRRPDREPMRAVALRHQCAGERLAIDRTADLHEAAGTEELGHIVDHHARPCAWVVALLELGVELSQHDSSDFRTRPNSSPSGVLKSLSLSSSPGTQHVFVAACVRQRQPLTVRLTE